MRDDITDDISDAYDYQKLRIDETRDDEQGGSVTETKNSYEMAHMCVFLEIH